MFLIAVALFMEDPPERWVHVGGGTRLSEEYLDKASIRRSGDKVTLWTRRDYKDDQGTSWSELEIDCSTRTEAVLAFVRDNGGNISHNSLRPHRAATPIVRNSVEDTIANIVCR